jgi:hypothetical protein
MASKNIGKYYLWKNGLRVKVIGVHPNGWYVVCDPTNEGRVWHSVPQNINEATEISEEQAKKEFASIEHNTPQAAIDSFASWRVGKPNISIKMDLKEGTLPTDEAHRIKQELEKFFLKLNIVPDVRRSGDGILIEFFDINEK